MLARETVWKAVKKGMVVEDQNGGLWKVEDFHFDDMSVTLLSRDGRKGRIPWPDDGKPVTIWEPSTADAIAVLKAVFEDLEEV